MPFICIALLVIACGKPATQTAADITTLIKAGNCDEIQARFGTDAQGAKQRGALAVCGVAITAGDAGKQIALKQIRNTSVSRIVENSVAFLSLATRFPGPHPFFRSQVTEVVFGASGFGPLADTTSVPPQSAQAQQLVVALLQFSVEMYFQQSGGNMNDLAVIWSGCEYLLGNSYTAASDYLAWQLFTALAELALNVWDPLNKTEFGHTLMQATLSTLVQNGTISAAARCDLGSPYERLKAALSKDTALLGPLERAVAVATGCTRGKYAPQAD